MKLRNLFKRKEESKIDMFTVLGVDDRQTDIQVSTYLEQVKVLYDLLSDINEEAAHTTIQGLKNTIYWMTGHVLVHNERLLLPEDKQDEEIVKYTKYFESGTSPKDFDESIPTFSTLKQMLLKKAGHTIQEACAVNTSKEIEFAVNHLRLHYGQLKTMKQLVMNE